MAMLSLTVVVCGERSPSLIASRVSWSNAIEGEGRFRCLESALLEMMLQCKAMLGMFLGKQQRVAQHGDATEWSDTSWNNERSHNSCGYELRTYGLQVVVMRTICITYVWC